MPDNHHDRLRVAVIGASQATGFGLAIRPDLPRRARAFPGLLSADASGDFEVVNYSRDGRNVQTYLTMLDELAAWAPHVIIFTGGGRESLVRCNWIIRRCRRPVPVKGIAHTPRPRGLKWVKAVPWRVMVWLLNRESRAIEWVGLRVGFGPEVRSEIYIKALHELIDGLMTGTTAHVIALDGLWGWQGEYGWWSRQRAANHGEARRIAATNPRVTALSGRPQVASPSLWLPDGAHLNECGHAVLAQLLADEIRKVARPAQ